MHSIEFEYLGKNHERLDKVVAEYLEQDESQQSLSRSQVKKSIEAGDATVNDVVATKAGFTVQLGDLVTFECRPVKTEDISPYEHPIDIVYEDEDLLVVNKPSGLIVHPGAGARDKTLVNVLAYHFKSSTFFNHGLRPGIVHRLDKDTTGLLVVAKSASIHQQLATQFQERTIKRHYLALVANTPRGRTQIAKESFGKISVPIARDKHNKVRMSVSEDGKSSTTHWEVIEKKRYAILLKLRLETGRTHQIRVHMNYLGAPLIGDPLYGDLSYLPNELLHLSESFGRQALHAAELGFTHPRSGKSLSFFQDPPDDFQQLCNRFP